jgi:nicotinamide mononucleotide adenylyltransferase
MEMSDVEYTTADLDKVDEIRKDDKIHMTLHRKYHCYIGRWQSPHKGHRWLIDRNLTEGKPVLILIRDVPTDENNPFTADEVYFMLVDVISHEAAAPEHIKRVSATEIRRQIRAGEEGWREMVMPGVEPFLEKKFK